MKNKTFHKGIIINILTVLLFTVSGFSNISSQIIANNSFFSEQAEYNGKPSFDMIFYYEEMVSGTLLCDVSGEFFTYSWAKYNAENQTWNEISKLQEIMVSEQGGYRVTVSDGRALDNTLICWVFIPKLNDIEVFIERGDCVEIVPASRCDSIPLIYYNPENYIPNFVKYRRQFNWEANEEAIQETGQSIRISAPYEDTTYKVTVEDKFGNTSTSEVNYSAIAVSAKLKIEILKADVLHERHDSITAASAPVEILFSDENQGKITKIEWKLGSGYSTEKSPFYVFTEEGSNLVELKVSNYECESIDSLTVFIVDFVMEFPNVFTPNGDGINDEFRAAYSSIKNFKITIVNRWGRVVYTSTDPSKGWDGNIGDKRAPVGVYYYFAEAEGYRSGTKIKRTGPLHLIREK